MRKLAILVMAMLLVVGLSVGTMALVNPWEDDGDTVNVELRVTEWGEVYSAIGSDQVRDGTSYDNPIVLEVNNSGGYIPDGGRAEDTLSHFANTDYEVSVMMCGNIPENTRFHVILNPSDTYDGVDPITGTAVTADKLITWDRRDSGTGYMGNEPDENIPLLTEVATVNANSDTVHYAMDAIHALPAQTSETITVVYTIAAQQ